MGDITRRRFLAGAVGCAGGALLIGRSGPRGFTSIDDGVAGGGAQLQTVAVGDARRVGCGDPFAGAVWLGTVPFTGEGGPLNVAFGSGLNGRLFTDLSTLAPDDLVTPNERYYIRTRERERAPIRRDFRSPGRKSRR